MEHDVAHEQAEDATNERRAKYYTAPLGMIHLGVHNKQHQRATYPSMKCCDSSTRSLMVDSTAWSAVCLPRWTATMGFLRAASLAPKRWHWHMFACHHVITGDK